MKSINFLEMKKCILGLWGFIESMFSETAPQSLYLQIGAQA